ncbi:MAG: AAA family ATPase [Myxococcota bacterium]
MKIVGLRGENLASLESFDVSLCERPLSEARLFTITGPTGSGKSTLLDSMCLALYDRVPRLSSARDGSEDGMSASDPRSILRRGAGFGWAEVDFVGSDGRAYRATWEVWRAHRRASGRIQNQRVRLFALSPKEELTGKHRTETLAAIQERIGLDFDQFRRAVLLAQGDFSAFLKARPEERAQLLERMTRTEVFGDLSMLAHQRHRDDLRALDQVQVELDAIHCLDPKERAAMELEVDGLHAEMTAHERELQSLESQVAARKRVEELYRERSEAQASLSAARSAFEETEPLRRRLAVAERLAPLLPEIRESSRLEQDLTDTEASLTETLRALDTNREKAAAAKRVLEELESEAACIESRWTEMEPELRLARQLDDSVARIRSSLTSSRDELDSARVRLDRWVQETQQLRSSWATSRRDATAIDAELTRHSEAVKLCDVWPVLEPELARLDDARRTGDQARQSAVVEAERRVSLEAELHGKQGLLEATRSRHAEARHEVQRGKDALAEMRSRATPRTLADALARLSHLSATEVTLRSVLKDAKSDQRRSERIQRDIEQLRTRIRKARAEARRQLRRRRQLEAESDTLSKKLELDNLKHRIEVHRDSLLEDGKPCPLCGAREHGQPEIPAPAPARDSERLSKLRRQIDALDVSRRELEDQDLRLSERLREFEQRLLEARRRIEQSRARWSQFRQEVELLWVDNGVLGRLNVHGLALRLHHPSLSVLQEFAEEIARVEDTLRAWAEDDERLSARLDDVVQAEAALRGHLEMASEEAQQVTEELRRTTAQIELHEQRRSAADAAAAASISRCRPLLQGILPDSALHDVPVLVESWSPRVDSARSLIEHRTEVSALISRLEQQMKDSLRRTVSEFYRFETVRALRDHRSVELDRAEVHRRSLLGGESTEVFEESWNRSRATMKERVEAAERGYQALLKDILTHQTRADELRLRAAKLRERFGPMKDQLQQKLAQIGYDIDDLNELERAADVESIREDVELARKNLNTAEVAYRDRAERHARFVTEFGSLPELADLDARLDHTRTRSSEVRERLTEIRINLGKDDERREAHEKLETKRRVLRESASLSADLSDLMGSADGRRFRVFAQGLTLDALLSQSNLHLEKLRPRYQLMRSPGSDIDIQVLDRDMGNEVRSVSTLSGGETFLVSLALALALSTLSAQNLVIESLFIDEGFGHLDRESLEVAVSTLDELQAEGRTVAIVSHVPDVAERIGYAVEVVPRAPGRSSVRVRSG